MELKRINEILSNLDNIKSVKGVKLISSDQPADYYNEKYEGGGSSKIEIFDIGETDVFLKTITNTDSYGYNERLTSIQFVQPITKTVVGYDPIQ
jgi:hypothetical protein